MVAAGKKAAMTRRTTTYTVAQHFSNKPEKIRELAEAVQEFVMGLDSTIEEVPKKKYIAYRVTQNIVCMEIQQRKILLFVKLNPSKHAGPKGISRDVSNIGHYGTGDLEITLKSLQDFEQAKPSLKLAYERMGG